MSLSIQTGSMGTRSKHIGPEGSFVAGVHKNKTFPTPNGGKISVEGQTILVYTGPSKWEAAVGKGITINGSSYYEGIGGQLYLNGVLQE